MAVSGVAGASPVWYWDANASLGNPLQPNSASPACVQRSQRVT
jgi:hypothetical protein